MVNNDLMDSMGAKQDCPIMPKNNHSGRLFICMSIDFGFLAPQAEAEDPIIEDEGKKENCKDGETIVMETEIEIECNVENCSSCSADNVCDICVDDYHIKTDEDTGDVVCTIDFVILGKVTDYDNGAPI